MKGIKNFFKIKERKNSEARITNVNLEIKQNNGSSSLEMDKEMSTESEVFSLIENDEKISLETLQKISDISLQEKATVSEENWKNINSEFTFKLQKEWEENEFVYEAVREWLDIGLQVSDEIMLDDCRILKKLVPN